MHLNTSISTYISASISSSLLNFVSYLYGMLPQVCTTLNILILIICIYIWAYNCIIDCLFIGTDHSNFIYSFSKSFILIMFSEILIFFSMFWSKYQESIDISILTGLSTMETDPARIAPLHPDIPSLMNILLCISSILVFLYLYIQYSGIYKYIGLNIVLLLGLMFSSVEYFDYYTSVIHINDGIVASYIFVITGLHLVHVVIGLFSFNILITLVKVNLFNLEYSIGLIFTSLYWQLVDFMWTIVYIALFICREVHYVLNFFSIDMF